MDADTFRAVMAPDFDDRGLYPDAKVNFFIAMASRALRADIWGDRLDDATVFYVAHLLYLNRPQTVVNGIAVPGSGNPLGFQTSKSVGGVSVGTDYSASRIEGGGSFNLTKYGQQYLTILQNVAVGVVQL